MQLDNKFDIHDCLHEYSVEENEIYDDLFQAFYPMKQNLRWKDADLKSVMLMFTEHHLQNSWEIKFGKYKPKWCESNRIVISRNYWKET